jgi:hypothetical protein
MILIFGEKINVGLGLENPIMVRKTSSMGGKLII